MPILLAVVLGILASRVTGLTVQPTPLSVSVSETVPLGTVIGIFSISDDHGRVTVYPVGYGTKELVTVQPVQYASPNDTSTSTQYKILLNQTLDYEQRFNVQLHFSAVNTMMEKIDFYVSLIILDENDNAPVFDKINYSFTVLRSASPGTMIGVVRAIDMDSGNGGKVSFSLQINQDFKSMFSIDPFSGIITLIERPGENISHISFIVHATVAIKCVQTECNTDKGGYCCSKEASSEKKDCCCYRSATGFGQTCSHHSEFSFPTWAGVLVVLVLIGIIGGIVGAVIYFRRRRQTNVPYTTQT